MALKPDEEAELAQIDAELARRRAQALAAGPVAAPIPMQQAAPPPQQQPVQAGPPPAAQPPPVAAAPAPAAPLAPPDQPGLMSRAMDAAAGVGRGMVRGVGKARQAVDGALQPDAGDSASAPKFGQSGFSTRVAGNLARGVGRVGAGFAEFLPDVAARSAAYLMGPEGNREATAEDVGERLVRAPLAAASAAGHMIVDPIARLAADVHDNGAVETFARNPMAPIEQVYIPLAAAKAGLARKATASDVTEGRASAPGETIAGPVTRAGAALARFPYTAAAVGGRVMSADLGGPSILPSGADIAGAARSSFPWTAKAVDAARGAMESAAKPAPSTTDIMTEPVDALTREKRPAGTTAQGLRDALGQGGGIAARTQDVTEQARAGGTGSPDRLAQLAADGLVQRGQRAQAAAEAAAEGAQRQAQQEFEMQQQAEASRQAAAQQPAPPAPEGRPLTPPPEESTAPQFTPEQRLQRLERLVGVGNVPPEMVIGQQVQDVPPQIRRDAVRPAPPAVPAYEPPPREPEPPPPPPPASQMMGSGAQGVPQQPPPQQAAAVQPQPAPAPDVEQRLQRLEDLVTRTPQAAPPPAQQPAPQQEQQALPFEAPPAPAAAPAPPSGKGAAKMWRTKAQPIAEPAAAPEGAPPPAPQPNNPPMRLPFRKAPAGPGPVDKNAPQFKAGIRDAMDYLKDPEGWEVPGKRSSVWEAGFEAALAKLHKAQFPLARLRKKKAPSQ